MSLSNWRVVASDDRVDIVIEDALSVVLTKLGVESVEVCDTSFELELVNMTSVSWVETAADVSTLDRPPVVVGSDGTTDEVPAATEDVSTGESGNTGLVVTDKDKPVVSVNDEVGCSVCPKDCPSDEDTSRASGKVDCSVWPVG